MAQRELAPFDLALWAWADAEVPQSLTSVIAAAAAQGGGPSQITFETVFTEGANPIEAIRPRGVMEAARETATSVELLRLEDQDGPWLLAALSTPHVGVYHLLSSMPSTHPRWQRVDRWVNASRNVSRCFLNHRDFKSIGDGLTEFGDVEVGRWTARDVNDASSVSRGFPVRSRAQRPTYLDAIREAESRMASIRTLTLHIRDTLSMHLRRTAGATYYSGSFQTFEAFVLARLAQAAADRRRLVANRERQPRQVIRPLAIRLERPILETTDDTAKVIDELQSISNTSMAVFHRNPYLHVAVTDEIDGSNFDLTVTVADVIDIFPGYRATMVSVSRLIHRLGERFGANEITEPESPPRVSIAELAER